MGVEVADGRGWLVGRLRGVALAFAFLALEGDGVGVKWLARRTRCRATVGVAVGVLVTGWARFGPWDGRRTRTTVGVGLVVGVLMAVAVGVLLGRLVAMAVGVLEGVIAGPDTVM